MTKKLSIMSVKFRGTKQPISFGTTKMEGFIVDSQEDSVEGSELEITNEEGNVVGHFSGYGIKYSRSASVIPLVGATAPAPGDTFTIGTEADNFSFIVKTVKKSRAKADAEKWDISGTFYESVPMESTEVGEE